jgi:hypothetical protein
MSTARKQPRNDNPITIGNSKLGNNIAILSITPAALCVSRLLGLCQVHEKDCYARKFEKRFPNTVISLELKQMAYWDMKSAFDIALDIAALNASKRTKITAFRIGVSGDFRHQPDLDKAENLAAHLKEQGIVTYVYTARSDLDFSEIQHLVVNGSGFMAHNRFQVAYSLEKNPDGGWLATDKNGNKVSCNAVCAGDCRKCSLCQQKGGAVIAVKKH